MGLSTPELELLREALTEDPANPVFIDVARELIHRKHWEEAVSVLQAGVALEPDLAEAWQLLAEAAYIDGQYVKVLTAVSHLDPEPTEHPHLVRLSIQALEMLHRLEEARAAVEAFLEAHPEDALMLDLSARLTSAGPAPVLTALDRFYTIERAEAYAALGRQDRAFRVLRRVAFHHPRDGWLRARLKELRHGPFESVDDDLSEDLGEVFDEAAEPPTLAVPTPGLAVAADESAVADQESTDVGPGVGVLRGALRDEDEQETQPALMPADERARILEEAGDAGDHVGGGALVEELDEDYPTEETEDGPSVSRPGLSDPSSDFEPLDTDALSEEVLGHGRVRKRRRRSLIK